MIHQLTRLVFRRRKRSDGVRRPFSKPLIVALDSGELVCAIIPSDARLNLKAIASAAGAKNAELSNPKKAERTTGYVVGGISPLGQRKRLRTFIDASAPPLGEIVVNGGRRGLQILVQRFDSASGLHLTKPLKLGLSRIRRAPLGGKNVLQDVAKENGGFPSVPKPSRMFRSNTRNTMFDRCSAARRCTRSLAKTQTHLPETLADRSPARVLRGGLSLRMVRPDQRPGARHGIKLAQKTSLAFPPKLPRRRWRGFSFALLIN